MNDVAPLAERMRPTTLDDLVGQQHLTGKGSILRRAIEQGSVPITQDYNDCAVEYVSGRAAHRLSATAA